MRVTIQNEVARFFMAHSVEVLAALAVAVTFTVFCIYLQRNVSALLASVCGCGLSFELRIFWSHLSNFATSVIYV